MKIPSKTEIERLEIEAEKNEEGLSNMGMATHWIKGKGTFYYRCVCEFVPEIDKTAQEIK